MGSSKQISGREVFFMVLVFQQSGIFWLLPYLMVRQNGTAGLAAMAAGILTAVFILAAGHYWRQRMPACGFITALKCKHTAAGSMVGAAFLVCYLVFAVLMLYSLLDVVQRQLLPETPHIVIGATLALLAGYMAKSGIESLARLSVLCIAALGIMLAVSVAGTVDLYALEHALPLQIHSPHAFGEAVMYCMACYSSLLILFMLYPAIGRGTARTRSLLGAVCAGAVLLMVWTAYALCIFGQYSLQTILWIPVHLARMVQISAVLEQPEALFIVLWMLPVLYSGSLFIWGCASGLGELMGDGTWPKWKTALCHWGVVVLVWAGMLGIENSLQLLEVLHVLVRILTVALPIMLAAVVLLAPKRRDRL